MRRGWMGIGLTLALGACAGAAPGQGGADGTLAAGTTVDEASSAPTGDPAPSDSAAPSDSDEPASGAILMAVRGVAMDAQQSERRPLQIDDRLQSGDFFAYYVRVDRDAYVYVLQFYADGTATVLFPVAGAVKVLAGSEQRLPADERGWFRLDEATGTEHLYVIAAGEPLEQSDPTLAQLIGQVRASPKEVQEAPAADGPATAPSAAPEAVARGLPAKVARLSDPLLRHARERAAVVVRVEEDGVVEYRGQARDGVGVVHFPFRHE